MIRERFKNDNIRTTIWSLALTFNCHFWFKTIFIFSFFFFVMWENRYFHWKSFLNFHRSQFSTVNRFFFQQKTKKKQKNRSEQMRKWIDFKVMKISNLIWFRFISLLLLFLSFQCRFVLFHREKLSLVKYFHAVLTNP